MMANGRIRPLWPVLISVLLALLASGCSNSTENTGLSLVDPNGNHPANFLSTHPGFAVADVNQCMPCHGDDLMGGISNQSCFLSACHHDPEPNWVVFPPGPPQGHGTSAKAVPGAAFASSPCGWAAGGTVTQVPPTGCGTAEAPWQRVLLKQPGGVPAGAGGLGGAIGEFAPFKWHWAHTAAFSSAVLAWT